MNINFEPYIKSIDPENTNVVKPVAPVDPVTPIVSVSPVTPMPAYAAVPPAPAAKTTEEPPKDVAQCMTDLEKAHKDDPDKEIEAGACVDFEG